MEATIVDVKAEIANQSALIKKLLSWAKTVKTLEEVDLASQMLGEAGVRLGELLVMQASGGSSIITEFDRLVNEALQEITQEWNKEHGEG